MQKPERIKVIYNDDVKIIDFLSDLKEREIITFITNSLAKDKNTTMCLVNYYKAENIYTVILCNAPLGYNTNGNILMLFTHTNFDILYAYFNRIIATTGDVDRVQKAIYEAVIKFMNHYKSIHPIKESQTH